MNINKVGIQSYQQVTNRPGQQNAPIAKHEQPTDSQNLIITPKADTARSAIAVKAPSGDYSEMLSADERKALEMIFAKYKDNPRFAKNSSSSEEAFLGRVIDVKV